MVPNISPPYAEHVLKKLGIDSNTKATVEHIDILIEGANMCRDMVKDLEK